MRALLVELDRPKTYARIIDLDVFNLERGGPSPETAGVVYPVWFGTNRKPVGGDFSGERHDRTTLSATAISPRPKRCCTIFTT